MKKATLWTWLLAVGVFLSLGAGEAVPEKKFIGHSWDIMWMDASRLLHNIDKLETLPLDGIIICPYFTDDNGNLRTVLHAVNDEAYKWEYFAKDIPAYKRICSGKLKHNFIASFWVPRKKRLDWRDDAAWDNFANNMAMIARIAKLSGAKGVMMDTEDYHKTYQYAYLDGKDKGTFEELADIARKRGRQVMRAMAEEFPDCVYMSFWLWSLSDTFLKMEGDREEILKSGGQLWIKFLDGMLDELPPQSKMVDATENAYRHDFRNMDFYKSAYDIKERALLKVDPANRMKYRRQVQAGFGLYLDMYTNKPGAIWYFDGIKGDKLELLRKNFAQAMALTDEYCWLYGELYRWIDWDYQGLVIHKDHPKRPLKQLTWEQKLPGTYLAISMIRDPEGTMNKWYQENKAAGNLVNLVANPQAAANGKGGEIANPGTLFHDSKLPSGWYISCSNKNGNWKIDTRNRLNGHNSVYVSGTFGCNLVVKADVTGGKYYLVESFVKTNARPKALITWRKNGKDFAAGENTYFVYDDKADNGFSRGRCVVQAPEGATEMLLRMDGIFPYGKFACFAMPGVFEFK